MKREMFLLPQAVVDKIVTRYGYEKLGEFTFLLSQYCAYWDKYGNGDDFDFSRYSEAILIYFDTVRDAIDERHRQFVLSGEQMREAAKKRWEMEEKKKRIREQKRRWYVDNCENLNRKRRKSKIEANVADKNNFSSDKAQSLGSKGVAQNDAESMNIMNYEHNRNLKTYGGRARAKLVDNSGYDWKQNLHDRSGSLTGHNPADGAVIKGNHKKRKRKRHKIWNIRNFEQGNLNIRNIERKNNETPESGDREYHNPPQPCGQLPQNGGAELGNDEVQPAPKRLTVYGEDWIKIGDDFKVDLFDPVFDDYASATKFLLNGFEMWCRKKFSGERHDKWWLRKQLGNFANRQGSIKYMKGKSNG